MRHKPLANPENATDTANMRNNFIISAAIALILTHLVGGCGTDVTLTRTGEKWQIQLKTAARAAENHRNNASADARAI